MKVAELEGALLDKWVAKAEGAAVYQDAYGDTWEGSRTYRPSTDWSRGGQIIERSRIQIVPQNVCHLKWSAYLDEGLPPGRYAVEQFGEAPLVAAMRAYVASKFGEEVPDSEKRL